MLVCLAALRLDRPVKWIEDRREHLIAANHSRQQRHHIRAAVDGDGRILALDDAFFHDQGAYVRTHAATVPDLAATMLPGPYRVPAYRATGRIRLTNKTPGGTYRAPGRFESTFARERVIDAIAARLGLDAVEVRRRNLIDRSEFPYPRPFATLGTDVVLDSGDYGGLLDKALAAIGWDRVQADLRWRRAAGEAVGAGLAMFVEKSGLGPFECVHLSVDEAGAVEVVTGAASVGQGVETVLAQICADALGVDYQRVRVVHGQTDRIAFGVGAFASRVTVMAGEATRRAAAEVKRKAIELAAELLQRGPAELNVVAGRVVTQDADAGPSIALAEIARALAPTSKLRGEREPGLAADGWFYADHMNYPYGVHIAVVRVDRETGGVTVERYLVAYDIGKAVNPMLVEGQIAGGFAQGLGGALLEEFCYDNRGEPLSVTFADYAMPTAREIPALQVVITEDAPSPLNSLGLKGAGEAGVNAVGAAIAGAIDAAIGIPGAVTQLPVTPQRMREILRGSTNEVGAEDHGASLLTLDAGARIQSIVEAGVMGGAAMKIIYSSNRGSSRQVVLDHLRRMKAANSGCKVIDIGGAYCPWSADVADAFVDLFPIKGRDVLIGDINAEPIWEEISQRRFDFLHLQPHAGRCAKSTLHSRTDPKAISWRLHCHAQQAR